VATTEKATFIDKVISTYEFEELSKQSEQPFVQPDELKKALR
jgi:hypothetical protein